MGWTSYRATHYKNGKVDRKAECDNLFCCDMVSRENREVIGKYEVVKSAMVGSTYYAAVKVTKFATEFKPEQSDVWAAVVLTSVDSKDHFNFSYKDMDETCGPYKYDCPKGILDLLTPTDNEYANNWRAKCREQLEKKKNPNSLGKLPIGTVIQVTMPFNTKFFREGDVIQLHKDENFGSNRTSWFVVNRGIKFTAGLMKQLDGHYDVVKRGE